MAGLYTNISTSKNKQMPLFPKADTSIPVYSTMSQQYSAYHYYPAFSGGTAGRAIRINHSGNNSTASLYMYNADGTAVTDGVWNGGMTVDEASGSPGYTDQTDHFLQYYMDEADNKLYILTADSGTSPHTFYLSSVNEAGVVTVIGYAQVGNASLNNASFRSGNCGPMHRAGGDGSGNLQIAHFSPASGSSLAAAVPFRGAMITINITNGALSYATLLPSTFSQAYYHYYGYITLGTTANNIIMQLYGKYTTANPNDGFYGNIYNLTTGKSAHNLLFPARGGVLPWGTGFPMGQRWRGRYFFPNYAVPYGKATLGYAEADIHHWADETAVFYGLL